MNLFISHFFNFIQISVIYFNVKDSFINREIVCYYGEYLCYIKHTKTTNPMPIIQICTNVNTFYVFDIDQESNSGFCVLVFKLNHKTTNGTITEKNLQITTAILDLIC